MIKTASVKNILPDVFVIFCIVSTGVAYFSA